MKTIKDILNDIVPNSVMTLLESSGVNVTQHENDDSHYEQVAVIGFSGDGLGGALGLAVSHALMKIAQGMATDKMADDWLGELTNQLLGRLKNGLLAYGVSYTLALPMVLHGLNIQIRNESKQVYKFQCAQGEAQACIWVDANWDVDLEMGLVDENQHAKSEGATVMF